MVSAPSPIDVEHPVTIAVEDKRMATVRIVTAHIDNRSSLGQFIIHHLLPIGIIRRVAHPGHRLVAVTEVIIHGESDGLENSVAHLGAIVHFDRLAAIPHQLSHSRCLVARVAIVGREHFVPIKSHWRQFR